MGDATCEQVGRSVFAGLDDWVTKITLMTLSSPPTFKDGA